ncbi:MAG TPA: thiamine pyrophosphate-dependent enzyme [Gaiellaceae bacterium]
MSTEATAAQASRARRKAPVRTVRDAAFDVLRRRGLTTMFANPGSTEVAFLTGLPGDFDFVLGLHEGSVVGMATGYALGRRGPALVLLHTTAGLGNAVSALATARVNRAPLVALVGQQDRRHLSFEPFLAGKLAGLAGEYPVKIEQPVLAQDVPGAIERAYHAATTWKGPALVIVPMNDWAEAADDEREPAAAVGEVHRAAAAAPAAIDALAALLAEAESPALVVGAGADDPETWSALVELAERLVLPVFQETFGARAGFPQDHPLYRGTLPADRPRLRERLAAYDTLLVVGAPAFRQSAFAPGRLAAAGTRIAVVSDDPEEIHRSPAALAVLAPPAAVVRQLAVQLPAREAAAPEPLARPPVPGPPGPGEPLTASHVLAALAERLPRDTVVLEEAPVDRPELAGRLIAREPLGYVSAAQGGLGFALPGATGLRMGLPDRPVVAVVGDGSAIYQIQAVWSAAHYNIGAVFVVLANGGYAVMDVIAGLDGGSGPWPGFDDIRLADVARGFGCPARRIETYDELASSLDELVPTLHERREPLLIDVAITPTRTFNY